MPDAIAPKSWNSVLTPLLARAPSCTRLEPQSVTGDPGPGLAAAVHDPLWLLTRQWQFGEFAGEDAGTPLSVRVDAETVSMDAWQPGDWTVDDPAPARPLGDTPLDVLIERESPRTPGLRVRAEAGAALIAALRDAGLNDAATAVVDHAPLDVEPPADDPTSEPGLGPAWTALVPILRNRAVDAHLVREALETAAPGTLPGWLDSADRTAILAVTGRWLDWYRGELAPAAGDSSWVGSRLEHRYSISVGGRALRAPEAGSGRADWWSFDADSTALGNAAAPAPLTYRSVATPMRFPGMPADRFWEFEDAHIDIGALESDPHDLARLLVAECALIYGCDWLAVPLDVPAGSLVTVRTVLYNTTFGETYRVPDVTLAPSTSEEPWRMYAVTAPDKAWDQRAATDERPFLNLNGLVVAPVSANRIEGPALEEVLFLRDEAANLGWAVERIVEDRAGDPLLRTAARHQTSVGNEDRVAEAELDYLLQNSVPEWWIPYLPRVAGPADGIRLELARGAMLRFGPQLPNGEPIAPLGRLLKGADHETVHDSEVPREGVRVQRIPMLSRRSDGTYDVWTARRVTIGRGEGRSGLAFDSAVPRRPAGTA